MLKFLTIFYAIIWISSCISPNSSTSSIMGFYADRSKTIRGNLHYFSWQDNPDIYFKHTWKKITTLQRFGNFLFCLVFFLLSLRFSQSYHLPIFTFSTVNFRFQREIKFHTFTISAESSIDSFSRRLERTVDFFPSIHTLHIRVSGENQHRKVHRSSLRLGTKTVERTLTAATAAWSVLNWLCAAVKRVVWPWKLKQRSKTDWKLEIMTRIFFFI